MLILRRLNTDELPGMKVADRTLGILQLGPDTLYTVEKPWVHSDDGPAGMPFKSCIPRGLYRLVWRDSPSKGRRLHLVNEAMGVHLEKRPSMPDGHRFSCMFHVANYPRNVEGCIGPGSDITNFGVPEGWGVSSSGISLAKFERYVKDHDEKELEIL